MALPSGMTMGQALYAGLVRESSPGVFTEVGRDPLPIDDGPDATDRLNTGGWDDPIGGAYDEPDGIASGSAAATLVFTSERGWVTRAIAESGNLHIVAPGSPVATGATGASTIPSGSVFNSPILTAPPVALPSFIGGILGAVRFAEGLRPEFGGMDERVIFGEANRLPLVRWDE